MIERIAVGLLAVGLVFATGCESELDGKTAAKVAESSGAEAEADNDEADEQDQEDAKPEVRTLEVSTEDSSIGWVGAKVTGDHTGGFNDWTGTMTEKDGELEKLEFTVATASVFSDTEKLTNHLKSDDFFDVKNHPESRFVSKKIVEKPGDETTHEVTGDLTLRGTTKELTFPATINVEDDAVRASTEFTFNRFDFGVEYKGKKDDLIEKEVLMKIDLVAPREAERAEATN
jgi:polyisoprenoid-binding protein YceI